MEHLIAELLYAVENEKYIVVSIGEPNMFACMSFIPEDVVVREAVVICGGNIEFSIITDACVDYDYDTYKIVNNNMLIMINIID